MEYVYFNYVLILQVLLQSIKCSATITIPICPTTTSRTSTPNEVHLTAHGTRASVYVMLRDEESEAAVIDERMQRHMRGGRTHAHAHVTQRPPPPPRQCRLRVTAPAGHVVYVHVLEDKLDIHRELVVNHAEREIQCVLDIFLPDTKTKPIYTANMCDLESVPESPLLPPDLELTWRPPPRSDNVDTPTRDRMLIVTAVGKEATCRTKAQPGATGENGAGEGHEERSKYHTCMKIGWEPILCVSKDLLCNKQTNCPKGSTSSDEADSLCRTPHSWEEMARKLMIEFQSNFPMSITDKWEENATKQLEQPPTTETAHAMIVNIWKKIEASTRRPSHASAPANTLDSSSPSSSLTISTILNQYGPWGYLMLGMLICGGVLLLCGMWECCCRRPKPFLSQGAAARGGGRGGGAARGGGATVLIIERGDEQGMIGRPPEYEDLDQPPLYAVLFPNKAPQQLPDQPSAVIQMQVRRPSQEEPAQENQAPSERHISRQNSAMQVTVIETNSASVAPKDNDENSAISDSVSNNPNGTNTSVAADDGATNNS